MTSLLGGLITLKVNRAELTQPFWATKSPKSRALVATESLSTEVRRLWPREHSRCRPKLSRAHPEALRSRRLSETPQTAWPRTSRSGVAVGAKWRCSVTDTWRAPVAKESRSRPVDDDVGYRARTAGDAESGDIALMPGSAGNTVRVCAIVTALPPMEGLSLCLRIVSTGGGPRATIGHEASCRRGGGEGGPA